MTNKSLSIPIFVVAALLVASSLAQEPVPVVPKNEGSGILRRTVPGYSNLTFQQVLSWFPEDVESVLCSSGQYRTDWIVPGGFQLSIDKTKLIPEANNPKASAPPLRRQDVITLYSSCSLFASEEFLSLEDRCVLSQKYLDHNVDFVVRAGRGQSLDRVPQIRERCAIIFLRTPVAKNIVAQKWTNQTRSVKIGDYGVVGVKAVDEWTNRPKYEYLCAAGDRILICANDLDLLGDLLARMGPEQSRSAFKFDDDIWSQIDPKDEAWGIRLLSKRSTRSDVFSVSRFEEAAKAYTFSLSNCGKERVVIRCHSEGSNVTDSVRKMVDGSYGADVLAVLSTKQVAVGVCDFHFQNGTPPIPVSAEQEIVGWKFDVLIYLMPLLGQ